MNGILINCERLGDERKARKCHRLKWAIIGIIEHNLEFEAIYFVYQKFSYLDLIPQGYHYPEFYYY